ncbi:MAG: hypothetical protein IMY87_08555, partial [Chloroflexi bacterium]|nr:hypothetical protein [Chloroflexota bacterium]
DVARLRQLFDVLRDFPGEDEVCLSVTKDDGVINLELPGATTGYCPQLQQRLMSLLGEGELKVEEFS